MLTNRTNQTLKATQTRLDHGSRSLALVVDGNMLQGRSARSRHVSHPQCPRPRRVGTMPGFVDPVIIGFGAPAFPGSPRGGYWPSFGRLEPSRPWSSRPVPVGVGGVVRRDPAGVVTCVRQVDRTCPDSPDAARAVARDHAPAVAFAAMGG